MRSRQKHTQGFTLAELLMSIAIIIVLAAVAFPSIFAAQNNMRMVELNNAAEQIANAAQTQMTAMKTSGTWLALINGDDGNVKYEAAKNAPDTDTFYMAASTSGTLKGARDNGIIPSLSIDDQVRNGDYIIEFKASTASVVGVFYTDGKTGFFGSAEEGTMAAQSYYKNEGASTDQATRMKHSPMIGYYKGTPASATNTVALANPVVYVDDEGYLCVQNPNLTMDKQKDLNSSLSIGIVNTSKDREGAAFTISGLQATGTTTTCIVSLPDSDESLTLSGETAATLFQIIDRETGNPDASGDVFKIDLNAALDVFAASGKDAFVALADKFVTPDPQNVTATVSATTAVDATAQANIEWPAPKQKLRMLVTNPRITTDGKAEGNSPADKGTFVAPKVDFEKESGVKIVKIHDDDETYKLASVPNSNDDEAARQVYSGKSTGLAFAADRMGEARFILEPGSYNGHRYQMYELWLNNTLLGSMGLNGEWIWNVDVSSFITPLTYEGEYWVEHPTVTADTLRLRVDVKALYESGLVSEDPEEDCALVLRTAPAINEVQKYLEENAGKLVGMTHGETTFARGSKQLAQRTLVQEFGASSSVMLWTAKTTSALSSDSNQDFMFYYAPTPFNPSAGSTLSTSVLWRYSNSGGQYANSSNLTTYGQSLDGLGDGVTSRPTLESVGSADFAIPATTDYLYYRYLEYYDDEGNRLSDKAGPLSTWSPLYARDASGNAVESPGNLAIGANKNDEETFIGWRFENDEDARYASEQLISDIQGDLPFGADAQPVKLYAKYTPPIPKTVGLMYLEFDAAGAVTGWSGYYVDENNKQVPCEPLPTDNAISDWGYYAIVHAGAPAPQYCVPGEAWTKSGSSRGTVLINGTSYDIYNAPAEGGKIEQWEFQCEGAKDNPLYVYCYNTFFAGAITTNPHVAEGWEREEALWNIRTSGQFANILQPEGDYASPYLADNFTQTHDLDFSGVSFTAPYEFTGTYDGGGRSITNVVFGSTTSGKSQYGLFPIVGEGATLSNINLAVKLSSFTVVSGDQVGLLVGSISEGTIKNCTVSSGSSDNALNMQGLNKGDYYFGGIAGYAQRTTFSTVTVWPLGLLYTRTDKDENPPNHLYAGGIAGYASDCEIDGATVVDVTIRSDAVFGDSGFVAGGLIGYWQGDSQGKSHIKDSSAMEVVFQGDNADFEHFCAGVFVGFANGKTPAINGCGNFGVKAQYGLYEDRTWKDMPSLNDIGREQK